VNKFLFLLPYILSFAISLGVLIYAWQFRNIRGAKAYVWYVAGQSLWAFGYIFELTSPSLSGKIFWDQFQWVAGIFILISFPVFAIQYTETKIRRPYLFFGLSLIVPLLFVVTLLTDSQHHLLYPNPYLDHSVLFSDLKYDFTGVVFAYAIYVYLVTLTGLAILIRRLFRPHRLYKRQFFTVAIGFMIPIFFTILTTAGVKFRPFRDVSPFTFAIGNLIVAWGLFRYHLFDILPIARDLIVDNMEDLVVVLDMQNRIVDINPSALAVINQNSWQVIGQPAKRVLSKWPDLLEKFDTPENVKVETTIFADGRPFQYEIKSTLLHDKSGRYVGRVFVSRDISEHTILESQLQKLNEELEERVAKRTEELSKSVERHRASESQFRELWDATVEGIVIHNHGKILEVNDAVCKMFGIVREDAIGKTLFDFISPDAHELVRERVASESSEPAELPFIRAGREGIIEAHPRSIIYQGKNVRVVAIRDITKRKQAEKKLMEAYDTTLEGWAKALELRDKETEDHSRRVTELTATLAQVMGFQGEKLTDIRRGAILHDIGKMGIPDEILRKRGELTIAERKVVEQHPIYSYELLSQIPFLEKALEIPYCHHERWDGSGYPRGLKGEEIPLAARIFSIIDVWDAVQSDRPYNRPWPKEKAIQYLKDETGKYFDPECVSIFLELVEQGKI
jgi:PAS domain S-box-containing protein/putative nucleotidyltransferase with HDIG domain